MKATIKKVSDFSINTDWLFIAEDENGNEYYIMDSPFYKRHNLKSPVTKKDLDSVFEETVLDLEYAKVGDINLVTKFSWGVR